ncbi:MAG TPA: PaaI family thioesterase [Acidimicrobiales bacterium]|nr:PaaI family thioesterase [Acidimicrobiales bacterium]
MQLPKDPSKIYLGGEPIEDEKRAAKHRLVLEVKRLVDHAALLDISDMDGAGVIDGFTEELAATADRIASQPTLRARGGAASAAVADAVLAERSPVSGRSNPLAPPLHLEMTEGVTHAWAVWTDAYEGPPGCLHGGFVAAAFDDLMGLAQMASGRAGYTGTLTVRMRKPTPLNRRIDYEAHLERFEGRKIWCRATARDGEVLLADAEILFIAPRDPFWEG